MMKRMFGSVRRVCPKTLSTPAAIASDPRAAVRRMSRLVCRMDQDSTAPDRSRNRISTESLALRLPIAMFVPDKPGNHRLDARQPKATHKSGLPTIRPESRVDVKGGLANDSPRALLFSENQP